MHPTLRARARRIACAMASCLAFAAPALSADEGGKVSGLTLSETVRRAVELAPQIEASRAAIDAAAYERRRAGRLPDPMLAVGIDDLPVEGADAFDVDADSMTQKTIELRQEVPARAARAAEREIAARAFELARAAGEVARLEVARSAAAAWVELWSARRELAALGGLRTQAMLAAKLARARTAGGSPAIDVLAAEAAVLEIDSEIAAVEGDERVALAGLQRWLGDGPIDLAAAAPGFDRAPRTEAAALAALDRQPALRAAAARVASAEAAVEAARAGRHPDWSVTASYGQRSGFSDMLMLQAGVSLPLFARNRQEPAIAARRAEHRAALAAEEGVRRELTAQVRAAYAKWDAMKRQAEAYAQALQLTQARSAAALAAYRAGGDLRPWLEARRDETIAQRTHAQHLAGLGRAWVDLAWIYGEPTP